MKTKLIIPTIILIAVVVLAAAGDFTDGWRDFLIGAVFALSVREIGAEVLRRVLGR